MSRFVFRNLSALAAVLLTMTGLTTCSSPIELPVLLPADDVPIEQIEVINIFQCREEISQSLQQAIDQYTAANSDVRIHVQTITSQDDYRIALRSRLLSGEAVDIFMLFGHTDFLELSDYLEDLSDLEWVAGCEKNIIDAAKVDDKIYGIPYSVEGMGLIANRNIFEAIDVPLSQIKTWEELSEVLDRLDLMLENRELRDDFPELNYVIDFPLQDKYYLEKYAAPILLSQAFESPSQTASAAGLSLENSAGAQAFFDMMIKLSPKKNLDSLDPVSHSKQIDDFAAEKTALLLADTEVYRQIYARNPELENRLFLLPVLLQEQENADIFVRAPLYWAVNQKSDAGVKNGAKKFLAWLYQSDSGTAALAGRFGAVSPYRSVAKDTGIPLHNQMLSQLESANSRHWSYREYPIGWGSGAFAVALRQYYTGDLEWSEFLDACDLGWGKAR